MWVRAWLSSMENLANGTSEEAGRMATVDRLAKWLETSPYAIESNLLLLDVFSLLSFLLQLIYLNKQFELSFELNKLYKYIL